VTLVEEPVDRPCRLGVAAGSGVDMARFALIRRPDLKPELVSETPVSAEAELHDVLTRYPELIPADDLGFGRTVVVGREPALTAGYADLVLLDEHGRLAIVEVKKAGNPDVRRVVAQLLDYAAALWGLSVEEFELTVLRPFLGNDDLRNLDQSSRIRLAPSRLEELPTTLLTAPSTLSAEP
jgi:hypothetical protein